MSATKQIGELSTIVYAGVYILGIDGDDRGNPPTPTMLYPVLVDSKL